MSTRFQSTMRYRLAQRAGDVRLVERAGPLITELGSTLDDQLLSEPRPGERLRLLRDTTNRITRVANDAIQAYRRTQEALTRELDRNDVDPAAVASLRRRLTAGRRDMLRALESANRRYPWSVEDETDTAHGGSEGQP